MGLFSSIKILASKSKPCCEPVVISTWFGSTFHGKLAATCSRKGPKPSLAAYCKADLPSSVNTLVHAAANSVMGKVKGDGKPPAKLMMPGFSVTFKISRITDGFIFSARLACVHWVLMVVSLNFYLNIFINFSSTLISHHFSCDSARVVQTRGTKLPAAAPP